MIVNDLKELERFLKICRKYGVTNASCGDLNMTIGDLPTKSEENSSIEENSSEEPTIEELMYHHVGGIQQ